MTQTVSFPVEAHVLKYLKKSNGNAHIVTERTLLGILVLHALEKTYEKPESTLPYEYRYTVLVPQGYINRVGNVLPRNTQQHLGKCCTKLFNMALFEHLDLLSWEGKKVHPELRKFLNRFDITEDDVKLETLYRAYLRHCDRKVFNFPVTE